MKYRVNFFSTVVLALFTLMPAFAEVAPVKSTDASVQIKREVISINTADAQTLADNLIGIGLKKAENIVAWRKEHGPFTNVEQLLEVKGIGEATLVKNRNILTL